jgi:hypothetical protein
MKNSYLSMFLSNTSQVLAFQRAQAKKSRQIVERQIADNFDQCLSIWVDLVLPPAKKRPKRDRE